MPKVSDEYKAKKRELLFDSALACFAEKGFESSTMDDIVAKSGTSKGLVYNYFKSKEELYTSLMDERSDLMFRTLNEKFQEFGTAAEKLAELFRRYREANGREGYRDYVKVHMEYIIYSSRNEQPRKKMTERYKTQVCGFVENIVHEGIENGEFRSNVDPGLAASMFWANVDGISIAYALTGEELRYSELFIETEKMLMNYLKN